MFRCSTVFPQGHKGGVLLRVRDEPEDFFSAEGREPGFECDVSHCSHWYLPLFIGGRDIVFDRFSRHDEENLLGRQEEGRRASREFIFLFYE